jgi:hypothetical protein
MAVPAGVADERSLQVLLDKQEIVDLIHRWARGFDRLDSELAASCYHEGATEKHGTYDGPADAFVRRFGQRFSGPRPFLSVSHHISNILVEVDGDRATAESYYLCQLTIQEEGREREVSIGGRYLDRLERRGGRWGFTRRDTIFDWSRVGPDTPRYWDWQYGEEAGKLLRGTAGEDDPLYVRLQVRWGANR